MAALVTLRGCGATNAGYAPTTLTVRVEDVSGVEVVERKQETEYHVILRNGLTRFISEEDYEELIPIVQAHGEETQRMTEALETSELRKARARIENAHSLVEVAASEYPELTMLIEGAVEDLEAALEYLPSPDPEEEHDN